MPHGCASTVRDDGPRLRTGDATDRPGRAARPGAWCDRAGRARARHRRVGDRQVGAARRGVGPGAARRRAGRRGLVLVLGGADVAATAAHVAGCSEHARRRRGRGGERLGGPRPAQARRDRAGRPGPRRPDHRRGAEFPRPAHAVRAGDVARCVCHSRTGLGPGAAVRPSPRDPVEGAGASPRPRPGRRGHRRGPGCRRGGRYPPAQRGQPVLRRRAGQALVHDRVDDRGHPRRPPHRAFLARPAARAGGAGAVGGVGVGPRLPLRRPVPVDRGPRSADPTPARHRPRPGGVATRRSVSLRARGRARHAVREPGRGRGVSAARRRRGRVRTDPRQSGRPVPQRGRPPRLSRGHGAGPVPNPEVPARRLQGSGTSTGTGRPDPPLPPRARTGRRPAHQSQGGPGPRARAAVGRRGRAGVADVPRSGRAREGTGRP